MSARDQMRNGVKVTATALCQWERTLQGGLRATWRPGCRVTGAADASRHTSEHDLDLIEAAATAGLRAHGNVAGPFPGIAHQLLFVSR